MLTEKEKEKLFRISGLITRSLSGKLSEEEKEELVLWIAENKKNKILFERLSNKETVRDQLARHIAEDSDKAFKVFLKKRNRLSVKRQIFKWSACAAILCLLVGTAVYFKNRPQAVPPYIILSEESPSLQETPARPILTMADGKQRIIPKEECMFAAQILTEEEMQAEASDLQKNQIGFHTINVPPMCDFHFMLSDGTEIWMNASSSLRYPVKFGTDSRTIYASGEIYLEVAKDSSRPFCVILNNLTVQVLGTSFNIHAYPEENETKITLTEGKISAKIGNQNHLLMPGKQLSLDECSGEIKIQEVNTDDVLAWRRGFYVFKQCGLKKVISTLQRWYNVDINIANERVTQVTYTGVVNKEEPIETFLRRLQEVSDVKCVRKNNIISIY